MTTAEVYMVRSRIPIVRADAQYLVQALLLNAVRHCLVSTTLVTVRFVISACGHYSLSCCTD